jgi:protein involved in polysaccharide export with SLBB domain
MVASGLLMPATRAAAQRPEESLVDRPLASREALEALAQRLGGGGSGELLARVRTRLTEGDFHPGDRIRLEVQGETALTDTFAVQPDGSLRLPPPTVGSLPLKGVLRSEIEPRLTEYVKQFLKPPVVVRARPLLRFSVQGEVARPGIYAVPADAPLGDVLMAAGGTTTTSNLKKLRVERDGKTIWNTEQFQKALGQGTTIDAALLHEGDQIVIGRRNDRSVGENLNFLWVVVSLAGGIYGLSRAF